MKFLRKTSILGGDETCKQSNGLTDMLFHMGSRSTFSSKTYATGQKGFWPRSKNCEKRLLVSLSLSVLLSVHPSTSPSICLSVRMEHVGSHWTVSLLHGHSPHSSLQLAVRVVEFSYCCAKFRESFEERVLRKLWKEVFSILYASKTMEIFHHECVPETH